MQQKNLFTYINLVQFYLPVYIFRYLLTLKIPAGVFTYTLACSLTYLLTYLLTYFLACLLTHSLTY